MRNNDTQFISISSSNSLIKIWDNTISQYIIGMYKLKGTLQLPNAIHKIILVEPITINNNHDNDNNNTEQQQPPLIISTDFKTNTIYISISDDMT